MSAARIRQMIAAVCLMSGIIMWHSGEHSGNVLTTVFGGALIGLFVGVIAPAVRQ